MAVCAIASDHLRGRHGAVVQTCRVTDGSCSKSLGHAKVLAFLIEWDIFPFIGI
jgi:hypothetical protein